MALTHSDATCSRCGGRADQTWNISGDSKPESEGAAPHGMIQCKRQKDKVERVVVKR